MNRLTEPNPAARPIYEPVTVYLWALLVFTILLVTACSSSLVDKSVPNEGLFTGSNNGSSPSGDEVQSDINSADHDSKQLLGPIDVSSAEVDRLILKSAGSTQLKSHSPDIISFFPLKLSQGTAALVAFRDGKLGVAFGPNFQAKGLLETKLELEVAAISRDHRFLALATKSQVQILDFKQPDQRRILNRLKSRVLAMDFQPNFPALVLASADGKIYRWKFEQSEDLDSTKDEQKILERYTGHGTVISQVKYHPRGRVFFSGDWSGQISAWLNFDADPFSGEYDQNLFGSRFFSSESIRQSVQTPDKGAVDQLVVSNDGEFIVSGLQDGTIELWAVRGFVNRAAISAHTGLIRSLDLSPDGKLIASLGRDGALKIWEISAPEKTELGEQVVYDIALKSEIDKPGAIGVRFVSETELVIADRIGNLSSLKF